MRLLKYILKFNILFCFFGCSDSSDTPIEQEPPINDVPMELGSFNLLFPENNLVCSEGTIRPNSQVSIQFDWTESENATSYELKIENSLTDEILTKTVPASLTSTEVVIPMGMPFTWNVFAEREDVVKPSENTWNFYSQGIVTSNYIPFPAQIDILYNGDNTVNIFWNGSDLDDDIAYYDIYLGPEPSPSLILQNTAETQLLNYTITQGEIYYLEVVTVDNEENKSKSFKQFTFNQ